MSARLSLSERPGRHDTAARRQSRRQGRERGCSVYIAAEELEAAGIDPYGLAPQYRVWPDRKSKRGRFIVTLYAVQS